MPEGTPTSSESVSSPTAKGQTAPVHGERRYPRQGKPDGVMFLPPSSFEMTEDSSTMSESHTFYTNMAELLVPGKEGCRA